MSDIFREIDEELRRDNFNKLWARYGRYVVGLAMVAVAVTAAVGGWRWYEERQRLADSVRFAAAMELTRGADTAKAIDAFSQLARDAGAGTSLLARLDAAALAARHGETAQAIAGYKAIADDGQVDQIYRSLATLIAALSELGTADPQVVIAEVSPLTAEGNPWRATAQEVTALAQLRAGDRDKAREVYKGLADDLTAPQDLRARAAEMVSALSN